MKEWLARLPNYEYHWDFFLNSPLEIGWPQSGRERVTFCHLRQVARVRERPSCARPAEGARARPGPAPRAAPHAARRTPRPRPCPPPHAPPHTPPAPPPTHAPPPRPIAPRPASLPLGERRARHFRRAAWSSAASALAAWRCLLAPPKTSCP